MDFYNVIEARKNIKFKNTEICKENMRE